ncbi:adenine DNA glycosylase-like [Montipora capricornis]|uniref:adenine DNA glycosylase-like n=1 Tax=Montipora capricornis TaxID=246305 RepID=UPI0035F19F41
MPSETNRKKRTKARENAEQKLHSHDFTGSDIEHIRTELLSWYDKNKRKLPWRDRASECTDVNKRAYAVWVSEVMLQQTQVSTVCDYYKRWMEKWPTVEHLSRATLEDVNEMWSGLGYYSRAKRLHDGAKKVMDEMKGNMPTTAIELLKQLPGVGRYTAGAIASIAFGECTGVVDGNVIRVLSRLRSIGAQSSSNQAMEKFWEVADKIVPNDRPGDFNQALMEFGATLCTPQTPQCVTCPVKTCCSALKEVEMHRKAASLVLGAATVKLSAHVELDKEISGNDKDVDIEECNLCLQSSQWDAGLGVCNYPQKAKKKQAKEETLAVAVIERCFDRGAQFLAVQRPKTGLLAGLWEFPTVAVKSDVMNDARYSSLVNFIKSELDISLEVVKSPQSVGEVSHKFSHIHHKYIVYACTYNGGGLSKESSQGNKLMKWMSREELSTAAFSTGMRKVFSAFEKHTNVDKKLSNPKKRKRGDHFDGRKQMVLDSFFESSN